MHKCFKDLQGVSFKIVKRGHSLNMLELSCYVLFGSVSCMSWILGWKQRRARATRGIIFFFVCLTTFFGTGTNAWPHGLRWSCGQNSSTWADRPGTRVGHFPIDVWGISKCRGKYEIYIYWCVLMHLAGSATARQEITGEWAALTGLNCFAKYIQCYSMLSARRNDEQSHPFLWEVLGWGWRCRTSLWMCVRHSFVGWCSPFSAWLCYFSHQAPRQSLRRSGSIHKDLK